MWVVLLGIFVTLPYQHLTRPCLAECVLVIALGSAVSEVDSSVQVQCITAFKTQSAELESSETLVCVLVSGHLMWPINYVSSWGTTRTDICILQEMGPFKKKIIIAPGNWYSSIYNSKIPNAKGLFDPFYNKNDCSWWPLVSETCRSKVPVNLDYSFLPLFTDYRATSLNVEVVSCDVFNQLRHLPYKIYTKC